MKHLICVGAVYLDTILRHVAPYFAYTQCLRRLRQLTLRALHCSVPVFPEEDSKLRATRLQARRGGNVCNSLEVIEHLLAQRKHANEVALHLVTCLPSRASPATAKLLSSFGPGSAIDVSHCLCREDKTEPASSYVIRSQHNGSRTIVNFSDLEEMTLPEFAAIAASFRGERETWWHFEVCDRATAHTGGCTVLVDTNASAGSASRCHTPVHPTPSSFCATGQSQC
jgi:ketohexokinase